MIRQLSQSLLLGALAVGPVFAAEEGPRKDRPGDGQRPLREEVLKRFDANGDGQLDEAEREAIREQKGRRGQRGPGERPDKARGRPFDKMKKEVLKRFDADGDGRLNEDERDVLSIIVPDR